MNFANVLVASRRKLPFGIAQIGKAFRNEITPGNFTFRTREFEQMEIEYFVVPGTDGEWLERWVQERFSWYVKYGIKKENLRLRRHGDDELAHYAKACYDIDYRFPWGWAELEGIANRTDFDLRQHGEASGQDLTYFDEDSKERYYPYVIEPSGGVDRAGPGLPPRRLRGGDRCVLRQRGDSGGATLPQAHRSHKGGGAAPEPATSGWSPQRGRCMPWCVPTWPPSTTTPRASAAATAARMRSAPPTASPWTSRPWRTGR